MNSFHYAGLYCFLFFKMFIGSAQYVILEAFSSIKPLKDRIQRNGEYAVVTGGNRGLGWATVKALTQSGMKVIVGCRDGSSKDVLFEKVKKAGISPSLIEWIQLDLSSMASVRSFGQTVIEKNVPIALLINNAGIMFVPYNLTIDGFESHFSVNYLSHFYLTHLLMPRLIQAGKKGKAARIINLSSSAHRQGWFAINDLQAKTFYSPAGAYSQSKSAVIMFTEMLGELLARTGKPVCCYAVHPGVIDSNIFDNSSRFIKLVSFLLRFMYKSEDEGAARVCYTAFSRSIEDKNGSYFENCSESKPQDFARNKEIQAKLWELSCQYLNIESFGGLSK